MVPKIFIGSNHLRKFRHNPQSTFVTLKVFKGQLYLTLGPVLV